MGYLGILVLLSLLVLIHETGHLLAAKWVGIPVAEFAVGFGPKLWSRRWGRTEYSLRAFPLGGFVAPAVSDDCEFRTFELKRRLAFFLAGPLANLAAALPLFAALNGLRHGASFQAIVVAPFLQVANACWQVLTVVPRMFSQPETLTGVVGIVVEGNRMAQAGMALEVALSLTISLAVLNLLPIPILDGGQILLSSLEQAFPRVTRLRLPATIGGLLLLAGLMIYANVQDVVRYWG